MILDSVLLNPSTTEQIKNIAEVPIAGERL